MPVSNRFDTLRVSRRTFVKGLVIAPLVPAAAACARVDASSKVHLNAINNDGEAWFLNSVHPNGFDIAPPEVIPCLPGSTAVNEKRMVVSPVKGKIKAIGNERNPRDPYYGAVAIEDSAGNEIVTRHLRKIPEDLEVGKEVQAGNPLGRPACIGDTDGAHVHIEVKDKNGKPVPVEHIVYDGWVAQSTDNKVNGTLKKDAVTLTANRERIAQNRIASSTVTVFSAPTAESTIAVRPPTAVVSADPTVVAWAKLSHKEKAAAVSENPSMVEQVRAKPQLTTPPKEQVKPRRLKIESAPPPAGARLHPSTLAPYETYYPQDWKYQPFDGTTASAQLLVPGLLTSIIGKKADVFGFTKKLYDDRVKTASVTVSSEPAESWITSEALAQSARNMLESVQDKKLLPILNPPNADAFAFSGVEPASASGKFIEGEAGKEAQSKTDFVFQYFVRNNRAWRICLFFNDYTFDEAMVGFNTILSTFKFKG